MLEKVEYFKVSLGQMITGVLINLVHSEGRTEILYCTGCSNDHVWLTLTSQY